MLGTLTPDQCKYILLQNHIGRIGCASDRKVLILPVTYVFDGGFIYGRSLEGTKVSMMRKRPDVCFEVDTIQDMANWRSVVAHGVYEELTSERDHQLVGKLFNDRIAPLTTGETLHPNREMADPPREVLKKEKPVLYRIRITELSGKFEKLSRSC
jgi:nitroimidazol reductase NimA-like FMN-containing flavoprotein (pyridoxamine 5'-phosphate oxidase superfamily)